MNVDEFLAAAGPSLKERAKEAAQKRSREQAQFEDDKYVELENSMLTFLRNVLGCSDGEIGDVIFKRGPKESDLPTLIAKMPGNLTLRAYFKRAKERFSTVTGDEFYVETIVFQAKRPSTAHQYNAPWHTIESLADLGSLL